MFSKINRLESLLGKLSENLQATEKKRFTANQAFRIEDLHLEEGAVLNMNIQMNNMMYSVEIINECLDIINELKPFLPIGGQNSLKTSLNHYEDILMTKALEESRNDQKQVAEKMGLTLRQVRYWISKTRHRKQELISNE